MEDMVTAIIYINKLEGFPQIEHLQPEIIFQQDDALDATGLVVRAVMNEFSRSLDLLRWTNRLVHTIARHNNPP